MGRSTWEGLLRTSEKRTLSAPPHRGQSGRGAAIHTISSGQPGQEHSVKVCKETNQPMETGTICARRLQLFGHVARASEAQDHSLVVRCTINKLPT